MTFETSILWYLRNNLEGERKTTVFTQYYYYIQLKPIQFQRNKKSVIIAKGNDRYEENLESKWRMTGELG